MGFHPYAVATNLCQLSSTCDKQNRFFGAHGNVDLYIKQTLNYTCDLSYNFVNGAQYDQLSLTSACPCCSCNPVYGSPNSVDEAVAWCKSQCDQQSSCSGFFFQRHMNGHEICGFYTGFDPVGASAKAWHGHASGSQLCAKVAL